MGQIKFMGSIIMVVLFSIAIMSYVINFGDDNNVAVSVADDSLISSIRTDMTTDIETYNLQTNTSLEALYESEISSGDRLFRTGGQFKGGVGGAFSGLKNIITVGYTRIFGSDQGNNGFGIILTGLISFLAFVLGVYVWKTWKGNPD